MFLFQQVRIVLRVLRSASWYGFPISSICLALGVNKLGYREIIGIAEGAKEFSALPLSRINQRVSQFTLQSL